jgi:hypothetical protein
MSDPDWSFLYPKPTTLFKDHFKNKDKESTNHFFMCPASATKMKKTLVFHSPMSFGYNYDFSDGNQELSASGKQGLLMYPPRDRMLTNGPNFKIGLGYSFFANESLEVSFTSPFFHKTKYTESCSTIPGNFDIGNWYRPFGIEIQTWSNKGNIEFIEGEPLFYAEFKTDRPIVIKRYKQTDALIKYSETCMKTPEVFGLGETLIKKYNRFRSVGLREKILYEIEKNVFDEEPFQL